MSKCSDSGGREPPHAPPHLSPVRPDHRPRSGGPSEAVPGSSSSSTAAGARQEEQKNQDEQKDESQRPPVVVGASGAASASAEVEDAIAAGDVPPPPAPHRVPRLSRRARLPQSKPTPQEENKKEGDEEDEAEEAQEEAKVPRPLRDPGAPTRAMVEAHAATHLPFRSWCPHCVAGRRDGLPHRKVEPDEDGRPEVHMDYAFVRRQGEDTQRTILILKERRSRAVQALMVSSKGIEDHVTVDRAVKAVRRFGLNADIVIKVDNESPLKKLREKIMDQLPSGAVPQEPAPHESQSNGIIESGVKTYKGLWRVHLHALEKKLDGHIPSDHPVMSWMAEFIGDTLTKHLVAADGKTGYERLFGKESRDEGLEFAEQVLWRTPQVQGVVLDGRWREGTWLGRRWGSPVHFVYSDGKVHEVRSIQRRPLPERWDRGAVEAVAVHPWTRPEQEEKPVEISYEKAVVKEPVVQDKVVSRMHITIEDLNKYGFQANCSRCRLMQRGERRQGIKHTESCRKRIEDALRAAGDPRIAEADERLNTEMERRHLLHEKAEREERERQKPSEEERRQGGAAPAGGEAGPAGGEADRAGQAPSFENAAASSASPARLPQSFPDDGPEGPDVEDEHLDGDMDVSFLANLKGEKVCLENGGSDEILDGLLEHLPPVVRRDATRLCEELLIAGLSPAASARKVTELYSQPRVTAELERQRELEGRHGRLPRLTLAPGSTFDLREGRDGQSWDFSKAEARRVVRAALDEEKPYLVIGSPPCLDFSVIQELNKKNWTEEEIRRRRLRGRIHLLFCLEVYADQLRRGAHFLHEHPASASSWKELEVQALRSDPRVSEVVSHQCRFGLETKGKNKNEKSFALKPTRFMSSSPFILQELDRRCRGGHAHQRLLQSRGAPAAAYPPALCRAILRGAERQAQSEGAPLPRAVAQAATNGVGLCSLIDDGGRPVREDGPSRLSDPAVARSIRSEASHSGSRPGLGQPSKDAKEKTTEWTIGRKLSKRRVTRTMHGKRA